MPRKRQQDKRWLEFHGQSWRVTLFVPRDLQPFLGTRLKESLKTDSLAVANALKLRVVDKLMAEIEKARHDHLGQSSPIVSDGIAIAKMLEVPWKPNGRRVNADDVLDEAVGIAGYASKLRTHEDRRDVAKHIEQRATDLLGREVGYRNVINENGDEEIHPVYDPRREKMARDFVDAANGMVLPLAAMHMDYLAASTVKKRTKADDKRALELLTKFCERESIPADVKAITPKVAIGFRKSLKDLTGGLHEVTQNKYISRLSVYWKYLIEEDHAEINPFAGVKVKVRETPDEEKERPFTDTEVQRLLMGAAEPRLKDLMMIGALTGARLDAIVDMKVKDANTGAFIFKKQKKETSPREVPIHAALLEIVARRTDGKGDEEPFFPEWPAPPPDTQRERSFKASNAFTAYRRQVGVNDVVDGKRRALTNFHSFRRWFCTQGERTGYSKDLVAAIVGHKREGITLSRYSGGPAWDAAEDCIARIKLPPLDGSPVVERRSLRPRNPMHNPYLHVPSDAPGASRPT